MQVGKKKTASLFNGQNSTNSIFYQSGLIPSCLILLPFCYCRVIQSLWHPIFHEWLLFRHSCMQVDFIGSSPDSITGNDRCTSAFCQTSCQLEIRDLDVYNDKKTLPIVNTAIMPTAVNYLYGNCKLHIH